MLEYVLGAISNVFFFVLGLLGQAFYRKYEERRKRIDTALEKHTDNLQKSYFNPASKMLLEKVANSDIMRMWDYDESPFLMGRYDTWPDISLEGPNFISFKAHFPSDASDLAELHDEIGRINEKLQAFYKELVSFIDHNAKVPVSGWFKDDDLSKPCFARYVVNCIMKSYCENWDIKKGIRNTRDSKFDFKQLEYSASATKDESHRYPLKGLDLTGSYIIRLKDLVLAVVDNEAQASKSKQVLIDIVQNQDFSEQGLNLYLEADSWVKKAKNVADNLKQIALLYNETGKRLKRREKCPTCKRIFE